MSKLKIKFSEFLENPVGIPLGIKSPHRRTLEQLQPIIILTGNNDSKESEQLILELKKRDIEFYLNPSNIETPVKGYRIDLEKIELVY